MPYGGAPGYPQAMNQMPPAGLMTGAPMGMPGNAVQLPAPPQGPYGPAPMQTMPNMVQPNPYMPNYAPGYPQAQPTSRTMPGRGY